MPNFGRMPATWPVYDDNGLTRLLLIIVQMPMLIHTCRMSSIDSRVIDVGWPPYAESFLFTVQSP